MTKLLVPHSPPPAAKHSVASANRPAAPFAPSRWLEFVLTLLLIATWPGRADTPRLMTFQGRVQVHGTNYSGPGLFRFALVDGGKLVYLPPRPPFWLHRTLWSHDGTSGSGAMPDSVVSVPVSNGLYSVVLGDTSLTNMTQTLPPLVFTNAVVYLRVWFDDGVNGAQLLTPDQRITATAYALQAATVETGAITTEMLADGAVSGSKVKPGSISLAQMDDGGLAAYDGFLETARPFGQTNSLAFGDLSLVSPSNGISPSFVFTLGGAAFGSVLGFVGREGISEPYQYVVEVIAPSAALVPNDQMGRPGSLSFIRNGRTTRFVGNVTACSLGSYDGTNVLYTFRLEPPLASMALWSDYRVFQEVAVPTMLTSLYRDLTGDSLSTALTATYEKKDLITQFGEVGLDFFNRQLEETGIFYYFRHTDELPTLVLLDDSGGCPAAPNSPFDYYGDQPANAPVGVECVQRLQRAFRLSTRKSSIESYDFSRPSLDLTQSASSVGAGETFEFLPSPDALTVGGSPLANLRQQRRDVERNTMSGAGNAPDLRAGCVFEVNDRTGTGLRNTYLLTAVRHAGFRRQTNSAAGCYYGCQFEVIPASVNYRPAQKSPKPSAQTCTAVVTGPADEEIHVDEKGRVKVQFHWDRYGVLNEKSSAWIRVANAWAGSGHGVLFLPRIGDEVLVEFLQGDPDQPIVTGSLLNGRNPSPYALPANKTVSTIKTRSSKGGANTDANEIKFEDKTGSESFDIKAQKDFNLTAKHDLNITAGGDMIISALTLKLASSQGVGIGTGADPAFSLKASGAVAASAFQGDGSSLTGLSAAALVSGTVSDARLSPNVALLGLTQTFTGQKSFSQSVGIGTGSPQDAMLDVEGPVRLNDNDLFLRGGADRNHGLGWYGSSKLFGDANVDGPVLYGCSGGALGTLCETPTMALAWDNTGNVVVDPSGANSGSLAPGLTFGGGSGEGIASRRGPGGNQWGLDLYTLFQPRLSIANNGNVGIGTTVPQTLLHLAAANSNCVIRAETASSSSTSAIELAAPGGQGALVFGGSNSTAWAGPCSLNFVNATNAPIAFGQVIGGAPSERMRISGAGDVGIGTAAPGYKLDVAGQIHASGNIYSDGYFYCNFGGAWYRISKTTSNIALWVTSDERLKRDVAPIPSALESLRNLRGVTWRWNEAGLQHLTRDIEANWKAASGKPEDDQKLWADKRREAAAELSKTQMGFVAQEVERVFPDWVKTDEQGYKQVNMERLGAVLVNAIKEQQTQLDAQRHALAKKDDEIQSLKERLIAIENRLNRQAAQ